MSLNYGPPTNNFGVYQMRRGYSQWVLPIRINQEWGYTFPKLVCHFQAKSLLINLNDIYKLNSTPN